MTDDYLKGFEDGKEAAAKLMESWIQLCDLTDFDQRNSANQFDHNATVIRKLKVVNDDK